MKKLSKSIKSSLVLALFLSFSAFAKSPLALVNSVKGTAFVINNGKQTKVLKPGDHLYDFDEVLTETGGQISFSDYYDHQYHLSGSGHVKLLNRMVELKRGYLWQQSFTPSKNFITQTANAVVSYSQGESIVSFDPYSGKTQLLVIKGRFEFANLLQNFLKLEVRDGQFSFIDNDYEEGRPRDATPLGFSSFKKVTSLFEKVEPMDKDDAYERLKAKPTMKLPKRSIASVKEETPTSGVKPGKIIFLTKDKKQAQQRKEKLLQSYEQELSELAKPVKTKFKPSYDKKSAAKVRIFGKSYVKPTPKSTQQNIAKSQKKVATKSERAPASVDNAKSLNSGKKSPQPSSEFEKSVLDAYKNQMRHNQETNDLIKDLKNYKQDYKTSY